jgi:hypothetical protein
MAARCASSMAAAFVSNGPAINPDLSMSPSEVGVQYQPDGRLSTFTKNTATFAGKLLIIPHFINYSGLSYRRFQCRLELRHNCETKIGVGLSTPLLRRPGYPWAVFPYLGISQAEISWTHTWSIRYSRRKSVR